MKRLRRTHNAAAHLRRKYIDFFNAPQYVAAGHRFTDCCFLGCDIPTAMEDQIGGTCLIFPRMGRTYNVFRAQLYDGDASSSSPWTHAGCPCGAPNVTTHMHDSVLP